MNNNEKRCPKCSAEISEWNFMGSSLDHAEIDNKTGAMAFEVEIECLKCGELIYGILWLVEINSYSKFKQKENPI